MLEEWVNYLLNDPVQTLRQLSLNNLPGGVSLGNKGHGPMGKIEENLLKGWFTKMYWVKSEKQNIPCCVSKQRVSQSSAIAATKDGELVSPEETQEGKNTCHLVAIRMYPLPVMSPEETQDVKKQATGPRRVRCTSKE